MAVRLKLAVRDGWKQVDNERFGQVLEVRFVDTVSDKVMFRYAPKLEDRVFWEQVFGKLAEYDGLHKKIYQLVQTLEGETVLSDGEVERLKKDSSQPDKKKEYGKIGDDC